MQENKKNYISFLRVIAIFFVLYNHLEIFNMYKTSESSIIYLFFSSFCKFAVPLFLMIAGALLIPKKEGIKEIINKRVSKIFILLLIFSILYCIFESNSPYRNIKGFITGFLCGKIEESYWFMYLYIGFLLILPILKVMVKNIDNNLFKYVFVLSFCYCSILPILKIILKYVFDIDILGDILNIGYLANWTLLFPIIGYYIEYKVDINKVKTKHLVFLSVLSITGIIITMFMVCLCEIESNINVDAFNIFSYIPAITIYLIVKKVLLNKKTKIDGLIIAVEKSLTYIYLSDVIIKNKLYYSKYYASIDSLGIFLKSIIWIIISISITTCIYYFISKIFKRIKGIGVKID